MSEQVQKKSSYKKLFSNTLIFAIGSFSSKVLILLLVKVYTTYLTQDELGVNDVIAQIANWLQPLVTMTISEAVIRFGLDKAYSKRNIFTIGNLICFGGFAVLGIILPIVAISGVADKYLGGYSLLIYIYVVMSGLKLVYSTFVRALEKVTLFAVNGILTTLLTLFGTVFFIIGFGMGNTGYLLSIILSDFLSVVFLTFAARLWRYLDFRHIDFDLLKVMLRYSLPLIPAQVLWLITNSSDSFMTMHYLGEAKNGILSASYKIPNLVATVYFMFGQAWNMSAILEDDSDDRNEFYSNVFRLNQCLLYILAAGCLLIVGPLTNIWMGPAVWESAKYSPILIYSSVLSCFVTFLGSIYLTSKRTKRSLATSLVSGVVNIGLNIILIPTIGLYGPAISTVVSYLAVFVIRAYDSRRIVPFDLDLPRLLVNNVLLIIMVLVNVIYSAAGHGAIVILLPVLFIAVLLLNYKPLWSMVRTMLPSRIVRIVERLGIKRLLLIGIMLCGILLLSVMTSGWLFYIGFGTVFSVSLMLRSDKGVYLALGMIFMTALFEHTAGAAAFVTGILTIIFLIKRRRLICLPLLVIFADICIASLYGIWAITFVVCIETAIVCAIFRKPIITALQSIMFHAPDNRKKAAGQQLDNN